MVTIEEVAKRIKNGAEKYGWSNNDYDWKPKTLTHYDVPEFCIKVLNSVGIVVKGVCLENNAVFMLKTPRHKDIVCGFLHIVTGLKLMLRIGVIKFYKRPLKKYG